MSSLIGRREPFALATVVKTEGSSLGKPGFKVIISSDGDVLYGSLGGACPESAIVNTAERTLATGTPKTVKVFLESTEKSVEATIKSQTEDEVHVETNCGGMMEVYVEPYLPQQRLVLVGQGGKDDVEDALVRFGKILDFEVVVIDHAPVLKEEADLIIDEPDYDISKFKLGKEDSVVVLTKGERDVAVLKALSNFRPKYVGIMASRQRAMDDLEALKKEGVNEEFITSVHAPTGADIGAITPSEIALSILAEIVSEKHGKKLPSKEKATVPAS